MRIQTNDEKKIVTIWLTGDEQANPECGAFLDSLVRTWQAKSYIPVIFRSGKNDLYDSTAGLLLHNRDTAVKKEMEQEKAMRI